MTSERNRLKLLVFGFLTITLVILSLVAQMAANRKRPVASRSNGQQVEQVR